MKKKQSPTLTVIGCLVCMLCVGVIYLWSVLKSATMNFYGWESGSVNLIASFMLFAFCVGNFAGGAFNDRFGPKRSASSASSASAWASSSPRSCPPAAASGCST